MYSWLATVHMSIAHLVVKVRARSYIILTLTHLETSLGLNLSICDGVLLSQTLSAYLLSNSPVPPTKLLEKYSADRLLIAGKVLELAGSMTRTIMKMASPWKKAFAIFMLTNVLNRMEWLKAHFGWYISGMVNKENPHRSPVFQWLFSNVPL